MQALTFDIRPVRWLLCKVAGFVTPAAYWSSLSGLRLREIPEPKLPGREWVRLKTILGGICGTDIALIRQRAHPATILQCFTSFPAVLGHENVAVVDEVGPDVAQWKRGDRVVVEPSLSCIPRGLGSPLNGTGVCPPCRDGRPALCECLAEAKHLPPGMMIGLNSLTCGSWGRSFVAHESQLHRVPREMRDEEAVLTDPIACSMHGVLRAPPSPGQRVLVLGGGIIALGVVMALRALGLDCLVTCVLRTEAQAKRFSERGADRTLRISRRCSIAGRLQAVADAFGTTVIRSGWGPGILKHGPDIVYECVGSGASLTDAMRYCRPRGYRRGPGHSAVLLDGCDTSVVQRIDDHGSSRTPNRGMRATETPHL